MKADSVGEMVATSLLISGSFGLVLWMLGLISGLVAVVGAAGLSISPLIEHFAAPR